VIARIHPQPAAARMHAYQVLPVRCLQAGAKAHGAGAISDDDAQRAADAIAARQREIRATRRPALLSASEHCIANKLTQGEIAALSVIVREVVKHGVCSSYRVLEELVDEPRTRQGRAERPRLSLRTIADRLAEQGYTAASGGPYAAMSVRGMLQGRA
jgi:hypothetical protein